MKSAPRSAESLSGVRYSQRSRRHVRRISLQELAPFGARPPIGFVILVRKLRQFRHRRRLLFSFVHCITPRLRIGPGNRASGPRPDHRRASQWQSPLFDNRNRRSGAQGGPTCRNRLQPAAAALTPKSGTKSCKGSEAQNREAARVPGTGLDRNPRGAGIAARPDPK